MINKTDLAQSPFSTKEVSMLELIRRAIIFEETAQKLASAFKEERTLPGEGPYGQSTKQLILQGNPAKVYAVLREKAKQTVDSIMVHPKEMNADVIVLQSRKVS